jgi:hypothetical protein
MPRQLVITEPGHYCGHVKYWFWSVIEDGKEIACGSDADADGACERGMLAMSEPRTNQPA